MISENTVSVVELLMYGIVCHSMLLMHAVHVLFVCLFVCQSPKCKKKRDFLN